jgi:hypothetical protein
MCKAVLAPVVLRQPGITVLLRANPSLAELAGRADPAAELVSFESVSHVMASSFAFLGTIATFSNVGLFPISYRITWSI